jgi:hypothetical protein
MASGLSCTQTERREETKEKGGEWKERRWKREGKKERKRTRGNTKLIKKKKAKLTVEDKETEKRGMISSDKDGNRGTTVLKNVGI